MPHVWADLEQIYCRVMKTELQRVPLACLTHMHCGGGWELTRVLDTDLKLSCKQVAFFYMNSADKLLKELLRKKGPKISNLLFCNLIL